MNMKPEELVKALRFCGKHECITCPRDIDECSQMVYAAAEQIERDQKEIAEMREEIERLTRRLNEPLTLLELVELNGQPVWAGEPFNKWVKLSIDPKDIPNITPEMKIRKGVMNVNGELVEIPPVNFYRCPPKEET